jgi:hypothetical protein
MLPDFERADRIGEFWGYPESRTFAELLIDCKEDRALRAVLVGMLSGARAVTYYDGNGRFTEAAAIGTLGRRVAAAVATASLPDALRQGELERALGPRAA